MIANWNGGYVFRDCLQSLKKVTYPNWELIVIDNGSIDKSDILPSKILNKKINIIKINNKTNLGFAYACNQGFKKSSGKYILLLNNDTIVTRDFLNILTEKMENDRRIGAIQPKIYLLDKKGYLDNTGSYLTKIGFLHHKGFLKKDGVNFNKETEPFSIKGACMLIKADLVRKIGLFDKDFFSYFEESDFCWRVWLAGYKVVYFPGSHIYHKVGYTIRRLNVLDINYHYYKNRICSLLKNLEFKNAVPIISTHLFISIGLASIFFIKGKFKNSLMILEAIIWNILNLKSTLDKRKEIQAYRVINDYFIFKNLSVPVDWSEFYNDFRRIKNDLGI